MINGIQHNAYPKSYLYRRIVQAKLYIDRYYAEHIDIDNISDEAYFSKFHFIRLFKRIYGKTPHQYLIKVRIDSAMQHLRTGKTVTATCIEVGFESLGSFSRLFKSLVGVTPSEYLIRQRQLKALMLDTPLKFIPGCHSLAAVEEKRNFGEMG